MFYKWKIRFLKSPSGNLAWRYFTAWRGGETGHYRKLADYVRDNVKGRSFIDVGCMWGVDGEFAFLAEEAGARPVTAVDVYGPTPGFAKKHAARASAVRFVLGDASAPETAAHIGVADVVLCAGVLYHYPNPIHFLLALRKMCRHLLILRSAAIPEINGLRNAAVFYPRLPDRDRQLWNLSTLGVSEQVGITGEFDPKQGYGNWFWGFTPSCLVSLLTACGFSIVHRAPEPFAQTFLCRPVETPSLFDGSR